MASTIHERCDEELDVLRVVKMKRKIARSQSNKLKEKYGDKNKLYKNSKNLIWDEKLLQLQFKFSTIADFLIWYCTKNYLFLRISKLQTRPLNYWQYLNLFYFTWLLWICIRNILYDNKWEMVIRENVASYAAAVCICFCTSQWHNFCLIRCCFSACG